MATAVTEDDPPKLLQFCRDNGYNDQNSLRLIERRAKAGNWEGHWRKHHRAAQEVLQTREEQTILSLAQDLANRREALLRQQFEQVEQVLPQLVDEALARKDFMDDKALVQLIKVLGDMRKDVVHNLGDLLTGVKPMGDDSNPSLPAVADGPVGTNMRLVSVAIAVLEAKERGVDPTSIIDAEFRVEDDETRTKAFAAIDQMLNED